MEFCTVCKSENIKWISTINQRDYWSCSVCEAKFLDSKYYIKSKEEKKHYLKHNNSIDDDQYINFLSKLINPLKKIISFDDIGLDFGCGYAPALAKILRDNGYKIEIYDPFFFPNQSVFNRKFNFITCSEVVEHFFKPYEEFNKINNLLCKNGVLAIMTSILTEDICFENWYYRRDPTHVVFYKKKTFEILAYQRNWKLTFPEKNIIFINKI